MEFVPTSLNKIWDITKRVISYFRLFQAYLFSDTSKFWLLPQRIDWEGWKWQGGIKTRSADDAVLKGSYKYTNDLTDIGQSWFVIVLHKVNRCLARYSPRAKTTKRPTTGHWVSLLGLAQIDQKCQFWAKFGRFGAKNPNFYWKNQKFC